MKCESDMRRRSGHTELSFRTGFHLFQVPSTDLLTASDSKQNDVILFPISTNLIIVFVSAERSRSVGRGLDTAQKGANGLPGRIEQQIAL